MGKHRGTDEADQGERRASPERDGASNPAPPTDPSPRTRAAMVARDGWLATGGYASVTVKVVESVAVESPPTQTSNGEASITQSRVAAFQ